MTAEAYPLAWPEGRKRTLAGYRETANFTVSLGKARDNVVHEVTLLVGGRYGPDPHIVISSNLQLRRDGLPLASQRQPDDPGVAVYFVYKKRQMSFACDRWLKIEHNMQAIAKTIEALRGIARWGTGDMLEAAFTGFTALPPPATEASAQQPRLRHWRDVFGTAVQTREQLQEVYRRLASAHHPDRGGDQAKMAELNDARRQALLELP
jgi:hypothetical protein